MSDSTGSSPVTEVTALRDALSSSEPDTAVLLVTWHTGVPVSSQPDDAVTLLDESLEELVRAELPEGAALGAWGGHHVLAVLPSTSTAAAARVGRRVRRAWQTHWLAPVHCSAVALSAGPDVLTHAESALRDATSRRKGGVVRVDPIHDDGPVEDRPVEDRPVENGAPATLAAA